jgi:hypothetical protein
VPRFYIISLILLIITMKFSDHVEQLVAPIQRGWETCITILSQWSAGFSYHRKEQLKCKWAYCSIAKLPLIVLIHMLYPADPSFFPHSKNHPFLVYICAWQSIHIEIRVIKCLHVDAEALPLNLHAISNLWRFWTKNFIGLIIIFKDNI